MHKKTWIKVKRGILEPKHRLAMGECWFLYLHILDRANWETGVVEEWKDSQEAEQLSMPVDTLRYQRKKLQNAGYITSEQKKRHQRIVIHKWTDPRKYDGEIINPPDMGVLVEAEGDNLLRPLPSNNSKGRNKGRNKGIERIKTPTSDSQNHISHLTTTTTTTTANFEFQSLVQAWERSGGPITRMIADQLIDTADEAEAHRMTLPDGAQGWLKSGPEWVIAAIEEASKSAGRFNVKYVDSIVQRWIRDGFQAERVKADRSSGMSDIDAWAEAKKAEEMANGKR